MEYFLLHVVRIGQIFLPSHIHNEHNTCTTHVQSHGHASGETTRKKQSEDKEFINNYHSPLDITGHCPAVDALFNIFKKSI